jgi:filamentous hemagglutinin
MKTSTSKRLRWNVAIWLAAGLFMTSTAGMASGPILPDPKAEARHHPQIEETANGIPLVNITAPSSGGVSRNEYEMFNVPGQRRYPEQLLYPLQNRTGRIRTGKQ